MARLKNLRVDPDKAKDGVWIPWILGIELLIARRGNDRFNKALQTEMEGKLADIRRETQENDGVSEIQRDCTVRAVSEAILLDWKNIEDDDGNPIEYSPAEAYKLLSDPTLADLYDFVLICSNDADRYRARVDKETAKN